ncbi:aspartate/tyrosine/aromatic aminotransferase [Phyllobacterium phragmitis]|uniref:aspartate transaminase n=1 Tax=Phyllobacterium phragmitis TaxID=2670329 RepID=A0A2S9IUQ4_9HYPH|nr:aminotransferase [Phyllobacterium phragmitis]PRD44248.1 aspartate/tyrosine/aromatic aminotransferase [Phyllobacterium phragmitis]
MPAPIFNPLVANLSAPPIPLVQAWAEEYSGAHGPLIDLSQAVPGYPPHRDMLQWLGEAASSTAYTGYGPIEGETVLRKAYAEHVADLYGAPVEAANVHITAGCNQAFIASIVAVAGAGDTVLMANPFYFNHESTLAMLGIESRFVDASAAQGFVPDVQAIAGALTSDVRALALVTPNNPTGAIYPPQMLQAVYDLCRANGTWLILDETYRDFLPSGSEAPHRLLSLPGWQDTLIQLYSFSKSFCIPGHRLGAIVAGSEVVENVAKVMDNLQICAPRPPQAAIARAIAPLGSWREANRMEIVGRAEALHDVMKRLPDWRLEAIGAYFAFIRHPFDGVSSVVVAERLAKEAGVLALPGAFFGEGQERFLRFAFANADVATIRLLEGRLVLIAP